MSDLISRQAAIDAVIKRDANCGIDSAEVLRALPSAQPERMKGKWERRLVDSGFNADWRCSKCGWKTALEEHGYNYCPNCGADMRGGQHEKDY